MSKDFAAVADFKIDLRRIMHETLSFSKTFTVSNTRKIEAQTVSCNC